MRQASVMPNEPYAVAGKGTDAFENAYMGRYDSEQAYAEQYIDDTGLVSGMPENLQCYFDVEHFACNLFMGDYYFDDGGYVFCTNY